MTTVTRRYRFSASHRLCSDALNEEENRRVFGKCANPFGHGHDYLLEVSISGDPDPDSGLALERHLMDRWVEESVLERLDYADLNGRMPHPGTLVPTSENILIAVKQWLEEAWARHFPRRPAQLERLRLEETPRNSFRLNVKQDAAPHA